MKRNYIDADRLKAEIEEQMEDVKRHSDLGESDDLYYDGRRSILVMLRSFIDYLQQEQPEAPVDGEVHHVLNCHYLSTDNTQLCARLRKFPEGAKVNIFIIAKEDEKP